MARHFCYAKAVSLIVVVYGSNYFDVFLELTWKQLVRLNLIRQEATIYPGGKTNSGGGQMISRFLTKFLKRSLAPE